MPIEWWPRGPYGGTPWYTSEVAERYEGVPPYLDRTGADVAVVVPSRPRRPPGLRWVRQGIFRGLRMGALPDALFLVLWGAGATTVIWSPDVHGLTPFHLLGPVVLVLGLLQTVRVVGLRRRSRRGVSLVVGPGGLAVDGLRIPWSAVDGVVTFRTRLEPHDIFESQQPWSWLAVRVSDFEAVLGLTPFRARLANLTRRRLVLLVEASEVEYPLALRDALQHLVEHPRERASLATPDGVRLLTAGPSSGVDQ